MCSITGQREKLLKVFGQIGLHQLGKISVKSLLSLNACVRVIYFPPTPMVIRRWPQFIVSSERQDYKSSSLTTRPRRLLSFNVSCSQVSGSGSLSLLYFYISTLIQFAYSYQFVGTSKSLYKQLNVAKAYILFLTRYSNAGAGYTSYPLSLLLLLYCCFTSTVNV